MCIPIKAKHIALERENNTMIYRTDKEAILLYTSLMEKIMKANRL